VRTVLRKTIAFCGAARRLTVIFHCGPHAEMTLRPLVYFLSTELCHCRIFFYTTVTSARQGCGILRWECYMFKSFCPRAYSKIFFRNHSLSLTKFPLRVVCKCGSVLVCRRCGTLCTSGFAHLRTATQRRCEYHAYSAGGSIGGDVAALFGVVNPFTRHSSRRRLNV